MASSSSNPFVIRIQPDPSNAVAPAWVPPPGYFADVPMQNFPQDVAPAIYAGSSGNMNNPFVIWGGSAVLRDYSALGAQVYYSGGHEAAPGLNNVQMTLICDFSSLRWSVANVPLLANPANTFVNGYAPDGTPYTPHTYLGLQELPAAWGGAARGTLASFFFAGSGWDNRINLMDVSQPLMGYQVMATRQPQNLDPTKIRFSQNTGSSNYPIVVMDEKRKGWWASTNGSVDYTLFVSSGGEITQYPALGGNLQNGSLVLWPEKDLLIVIDGGYEFGPYASQSYRKLYIRNLTTGKVTTTTTLGTVPSLTDGYDGGGQTFHRPDVMGLQWVEELGCIVGMDQAVTPPAIVKLVPPPDPENGQWTWVSITSLQHWPSDTNGQTSLQVVQNGLWSKFRWVPSLKAFVYGSAKDRRPQVIKL